MANKTGAAGEFVQAIRVSKDDTYEAALSAAGTALKIGDKVTLDADGIRVTATTVSYTHLNTEDGVRMRFDRMFPKEK